MPDTKLFHTVPFYSRDFGCYITARVERRRKTMILELPEGQQHRQLFLTPYCLSYRNSFPERGLCARVCRTNTSWHMVPVPHILDDAGVHLRGECYYRDKDRTKKDYYLRAKGKSYTVHDPAHVEPVKVGRTKSAKKVRRFAPTVQLGLDFSPPSIPLYGTIHPERPDAELRAGQAASEAA